MHPMSYIITNRLTTSVDISSTKLYNEERAILFHNILLHITISSNYLIIKPKELAQAIAERYFCTKFVEI